LSQSGQKGKRRHILNVVRIFVACGALYLAFRNQNMAELGGQLLELNPLIFCAALGPVVICDSLAAFFACFVD